MYGEKYFLFLSINQNSIIKIIYIEDLINKIKLEKRIKQWEWFCDEYERDEYIINLQFNKIMNYNLLCVVCIKNVFHIKNPINQNIMRNSLE